MKFEVIENLLEKNHFEKLSSLKLDKVDNNDVKVYHNEIVGDKIIKNNGIYGYISSEF